MDARAWREELGNTVREAMASPEMNSYFAVPLTKARAQILICQQGLFTRHRRNCWAYLSGNCPEFEIKQKILEHEYEEVIKDDYSDQGHRELIIRQGEAVGLSRDDILEARPLPTTQAALYAWAWITRNKSWIEGIAALTVTEWNNDDRLLRDQGGGHSTRMAKKWQEELGLTWDKMPNYKAHGEADERHSEMFLPFLARFGTGANKELAVRAAKESLDLLKLYRKGVADAMTKID